MSRSRSIVSLGSFAVGLIGVVGGLAWGSAEGQREGHNPIRRFAPHAGDRSPPESPADEPAPHPAPSESVRLQYTSSAPHPIVVGVRHVVRGTSPPLETRLRLEGRVEYADVDEGGGELSAADEAIVRRQYRVDSVDVQMATSERRLVSETTDAIARSLRTLSPVYRTDTIGRPIESERRHSRRRGPVSHALVARALTLLHPRFRTDAVLPGERWRYTLRTRKTVGSRVELDTGRVQVRTEFVGIRQQGSKPLAVLKTRYDLAVRSARADHRDADLEIRGHGRGHVLFDIDAGTIHTSRIALDYRSEGRATRRLNGWHEVTLHMGRTDP